MKTTFVIAVSICFLLFGCSTINPTANPGNSDWVNKHIAQFQKDPVGNPPQSIWQYVYNGKTVYYIPPQCCDQFSQLYDTSGKLICAPDGGLTGAGDGKCPDFSQVRTKGVLIWTDPRGR